MEPLPLDQIPETKNPKKQDPEASSPKKTSKSATEEPTSSSSSTPIERSRKKDFEEFKRLILNDPSLRLHDLSYKQVDERLKDQPHDMAEKFKAAHRRAVHQKKGNSKLHKTELDGAVDEFTRNTGLDPEHFPYEEYLRNDSLKSTLYLVLLVTVLAFFAPFGVIYLGTHIAKGLKAMYPTKFSWIPL